MRSSTIDEKTAGISLVAAITEVSVEPAISSVRDSEPVLLRSCSCVRDKPFLSGAKRPVTTKFLNSMPCARPDGLFAGFDPRAFVEELEPPAPVPPVLRRGSARARGVLSPLETGMAVGQPKKTPWYQAKWRCPWAPRTVPCRVKSIFVDKFHVLSGRLPSRVRYSYAQLCMRALCVPMNEFFLLPPPGPAWSHDSCMPVVVDGTLASVSDEDSNNRRQYADALQERTMRPSRADCERWSVEKSTVQRAFLPVHLHHIQQCGAQCVPTSTAIFLAHEGHSLGGQPEALFNLANGRARDQRLSDDDYSTPTPYAPMSSALQDLGFTVTFQHWSLEDDGSFDAGMAQIKDRLRQGHPTHIDVSGLYEDSHTVLVIGFDDELGVTYILDPMCTTSPGVWSMANDDLRQIWSGAFNQPPGQFRPHMLVTPHASGGGELAEQETAASGMARVTTTQEPQQQQASIQPTNQQATALPAGWSAAQAADGSIYYYNSTTMETQWDPPPARGDADLSSNGAERPSVDRDTSSSTYGADDAPATEVIDRDEQSERPRSTVLTSLAAFLCCSRGTQNITAVAASNITEVATSTGTAVEPSGDSTGELVKDGVKATASDEAQRLRTLFDTVDRDLSGAIDFEEFKAGIFLVGFLEQADSSEAPDETEMRNWFEESDSDGSGRIEFAEFEALVKVEMSAKRRKRRQQKRINEKSGTQDGSNAPTVPGNSQPQESGAS